MESVESDSNSESKTAPVSHMMLDFFARKAKHYDVCITFLKWCIFAAFFYDPVHSCIHWQCLLQFHRNVIMYEFTYSLCDSTQHMYAIISFSFGNHKLMTLAPEVGVLAWISNHIPQYCVGCDYFSKFYILLCIWFKVCICDSDSLHGKISQ